MRAVLPESDPIALTPADIELARRMIPHLLGHGGGALEVRLGAGRGERLGLPGGAVVLLLRMLEAMAAGNAVAVVAVEGELTTQEAADLLGVSRPFVVAEIDAGRLASRKVGTHRRIATRDLLAYKRGMEAARAGTLDELAAETRRLGLGY